MELTLKKWTKKDYSDLLDYLKSISEQKYLDFSKKLTPGSDNILGIRVPVVRDIAKQIAKGDVAGFLSLVSNAWHEEIQLHGLVIGYSKLEFADILKALDVFIERIDNWANCDVVCTNLKSFKKNEAQGFAYLKEKLTSTNPWVIRFVLVQYLAHFICDEYIDSILKQCVDVKLDHYYVKMGNAWLISTAYIKYPDKTINVLQEKSLDEWTHNKAIQKIIESYRVGAASKDKVRKLKINSK